MGAYLSEPVLEKHSQDESGEFVAFGASSMQGWRVTQEDAHNAILSYAAGKSLFAVYDGHGGHEVAEYCSQFLPEYIKQNENFKSGNYEKALEECFIGFDASLVDRKVVAKLKAIAGTENDDKEEEEINHLCEEASMPIEEVIAKYSSDTEIEPSKPVNPLLADLKKEKKPISPFLRAKTIGLGEGGSGHNKHIRFNDQGEEIVENGVAEKEDAAEEEKKPLENGGAEKEEEEKKSLENGGAEPLVNGHANKTDEKDSLSNEGENSPDGSEKENKDTNGVDSVKVEVKTVGDIKGKGKGKGKGKSSTVQSKVETDESEQKLPEIPSLEKKKKTAKEIYSSLLLADPESGDEDSDDSEDVEFAAEEDSDEEDGDVEGELLGEPEQAEYEEEEEDSDIEDEEDEEEGVIDGDFTEEPGNESGCTAVLALVAGTRLYVANAGDSRCVVCREGKAVEMSADHKPEDEIELNRIVAAGGKVTPDGRVNGGLNLSRALGDHAYKQNKTLALKDQMISCQPDLKVLNLDPEKDTWMILACDGIWNFMSSQEVVDYINERIDDTPDDKLSSICEELFDHCLAPDTMGDGTGCDNMTAVIVKFKPSLATFKDVVLSEIEATPCEATSSSSSSSTRGTSSKSSVENSSKRDNEDSSAAVGPGAKKQKLDTQTDQ